MKYITTKKHPELKEGILFVWASSRGIWQNEITAFYQMNTEQLEYQVNEGWIKEVEEKEFTKGDIFEFGKYFKDRVKSNTYCLSWEDEFRHWEKQR